MTNQQKFIEIFGINAWQQMIVFCGCAEQFKEYWTSPYTDNIAWIPVSEKLPEESGEYLVSIGDAEDRDYKAVGVAWFAHQKDYAIVRSEWRELGIDEEVIAWCELPKPYTAQEGGE